MRRRLLFVILSATLFVLLRFSPPLPELFGRDAGRQVIQRVITKTEQRVITKTEAGVEFAVDQRWLQVPMDWEEPNGRRIRLRYYVFGKHGTEPLVYLAGGPGGSGTREVTHTFAGLFDLLSRDRQIVAVDQRGAPSSDPTLNCPTPLTYPLELPVDRGSILRKARSWAAQCVDHWRRQGIDLSDFHTGNSLEDLEALRKSLGAEKLDLLGFSYGTQLALAYARKYPDHVNRMVLVGTEGPDHTFKLPSSGDRTLSRLEDHLGTLASPEGGTSNPSDLLHRALSRLEEGPAVLKVTDPMTNQPAVLSLGKFDVQLFVASSLGSRQALDRLVPTLQQMASGNFSGMARAIVFLRQGGGRSMALPYLVDCAAGASPERMARIQKEANESLLDNALNRLLPEACEFFPHGSLAEEFRERLPAMEIPVLFISGSLDGRTPPSNAEEVRTSFPRSTLVVIEGASHDTLLASPELWKLVAEFTRDGDSLIGKRLTINLDPPP
ncbi:MAG: alpha/beta fold hydrolase [Terriglobia bacterium]